MQFKIKKTKYTFGTISITKRSKELINEILNSGKVSCGKNVRRLEKNFAKLIGTKEAVAVSSGTDACAIALTVLYDFGVKRNDEIIIPALSFVSTGSAVLQAGFIPVFVDIDRKTLNIDTSKIEEKITEKTKAIMPVHLMGKPAEMDEIKRIAKKYHLYIIEDAAEAYGAKYKGNNVGTIGDMAAFSLYVAHIITTIEGGMVVTNNSNFAEIMRSLRAHGRACNCKECTMNINGKFCSKRFKYNTDIRFIFERVGFSCKMNELEAAIGLGNLELYNNIIKKRTWNFYYLKNKFEQFKPYFSTIDVEPYEEIGPHAFPIIISEEAKFNRDEFVIYLEKNGVDSRNLFSSIPTQCAGFKFLGYKLGDFPNAEYIGNNGIHIGIHQDLGKDHLDYFIELVKKFLEDKQ